MVNLDAWLSEEDRTQAESFISSSTATITAAPHFPNFPTRFCHGPVVPGKGFHPTDTIVGATSTPTSTEIANDFKQQIKATYLDFLASNPEFVVPIPPFMPPLVAVPSTTPTSIINYSAFQSWTEKHNGRTTFGKYSYNTTNSAGGTAATLPSLGNPRVTEHNPIPPSP